MKTKSPPYILNIVVPGRNYAPIHWRVKQTTRLGIRYPGYGLPTDENLAKYISEKYPKAELAQVTNQSTGEILARYQKP